MNFYARYTVTARLSTAIRTRISGPSEPRSTRTQPRESNFRWLRCTSVRAPRRREGWVAMGILGDAVDEEDGCGGAVEGLDDGSEALLAGRVPDLHFDAAFLVESDLLGVELNSERGCVPLAELILGEPVEEAALAHARRSDDDHLKGLFLLLLHRDLLLSMTIGL
jgi:hypothetical protein